MKKTNGIYMRMEHTQMNDLIAKPIIKDQFWIVTDGQQKVGNVIAEGSGFNLKINGVSKHFQNTNELKRSTRIQFQPLKTNRTKAELPFANYPTSGKVHNSMLDIKRRLHLYTKTVKSKCYYASGWFAINQNGTFEKILCPKYIFVQRYPYHGPFKTETEAENMINSL
jgi:hypothetical protein